MTPRTRPSHALLSLAVVTACAAPAVADDWVVRPVRLGTYPSGTVNVDVLLRGNDPAVGYTLFGDNKVYLSTLPAGQPYFQHLIDTNLVLAASFAADAAGNIYFAGGVSNRVRIGQDASGWGLGFVDGLHPAVTLGTRLPAIAVDSHGIPSIVATDSTGRRMFSRFDVPSASWQSQSLPGSLSNYSPGSYLQSALAYDANDRAVVAYVADTYPTYSLSVSIQNADKTGWLNFTPAGYANFNIGVSLATAPDGRFGVAFGGYDGLYLATYDGATWTNERITTQFGVLLPHSLAVDANGNFALAYLPGSLGPLHLTRRSAEGTWSDEALPLVARSASLTFDAANHPYIGASDGGNIFLVSTAIQSLRADDFTLDGVVTADDVPGFAQAIRHPSTYLAGHSPLSTTADLVSIGDHNGDVRLTDADARAFVDSLTTSPVPGLSDRNAGLLAIDQADLDPNVGSGTGNFFGIILSTGKAYAPGLSRADLTGTNARIDAADVDALHATLLASGSADPRFDLNLDGVVDAADLSFLVHDILGTAEGDANADGRIDADDFALVDRGFAKGASDWTAGDFDLDGVVTPDDYLLLDTAFAQSNGGSLSPAFLSLRESQFGDEYVSALLISIPEPAAFAFIFTAVPLLSRRRRVD